ncbi:MAG: hypothetical protein ACQEVA_07465 [Myxococcota bacterium]
MRCPACKARVSEDAEVCGNCGRKLREDDAKKTMMGIPAMGADESGQDEDSDEVSARSTLFGIPAASREESDDTPPPTGPGGAPVRDDATPVPDHYQGEGDARTQVADKDTLSNALRDSGPQENARSTMFGLPKASKEEDDGDDDIASQWGLGEESDDADNKTMVASGSLVDEAVGSDVSGEGTGYSRPQADVDPNVQTLMGMQAEEDEEEEDSYEDVYEDEYEEDEDSTQALSAEELERFEQQIRAQDGFLDPSETPEEPEEPEPAPNTDAPREAPDADDDTNRRRSLLQKLKRRSEDEPEGDDPRRTAAGLPAAQKGKDKPDVGRDTIDERGGGSGTRFSIPKPGGADRSARGAESDGASGESDRAETPQSGVLQARKPRGDSGRDQKGRNRGPLESSSSYRISGSSDARLEGRESSSEPVHQDKTAVLNDDQIQDIALDDTAAVPEEELAVEAVDEIDEIDEIALAETGVAEPEDLPGDFDETRAAAPDEFGGAASASGVVQPEHGGAGVSQPVGGSGSGVTQPQRDSGVTQPGESSGVVQPGEADARHEPPEGGSGVIQPDTGHARDAGVEHPTDSGIEPPASSTQSGGFEARSADSGVQPPSPEPEASQQPREQRGDTNINFGATPVGTSTSGSSEEPEPQQQAGFGSSNVPNPSQMGTESPGQQPTLPPGQQAEDANNLERKIRVVFAVIGALTTMGAGGAAFAEGVMQMPMMEKGIFLSPLLIGLLTLGIGVAPLSSGFKSIGLILMTLLAGAALAAAIMLEAAPVIMLLLVGGTLLTLCSAAFPALVKLVK